MDAQTPAPTLAELLDYPVHPFAELFPKMSDGELDELAADIKANGLHQPIVVRRDPPQLLDGRNRLDACHRIGREPQVEYLDGDDGAIGAFIIGQNINRRHQNKGQLAMAAAMILPETTPGKKRQTSIKIMEVSGALLQWAFTVRRLAPEMVPNVLSGTTPLKEAYDKAKAREQAAAAATARLEQLRTLSPERAAQVAEGSLDIDAAFRDIEDEQRREKIIREEGKRAADNLTEIRTQVVSIKMAVEHGATGLLRPGDVAAVVEAAKELQAMLKAEGG